MIVKIKDPGPRLKSPAGVTGWGPGLPPVVPDLTYKSPPEARRK